MEMMTRDKRIESHDLNAKLRVPLPEVSSDFGKMATQDAVHTGIHAPSRVRAAHAGSCHCLCHECKRLCPLVSRETDGPSIRLAETLDACPAATARSARFWADQVAGGMHPHVARSSREENMIMTAVRGGGGAKCHPDPTPRTTLSKNRAQMVISAARCAQSDDQH